MLSYDSLVLHAKERQMPPGKLRGAAREYLQVLALKAFYGLPKAEKLILLGGTALRLGYDLPRFSEDLDFDAKSLSYKEWKNLLEETAHDLSRQGISAEVHAAEKGSLLTGDLRFKGFLQAYRLAQNPGEKLRIKMEANRPGYSFESEPRVISGYGEMFPVPFAAPGLMAGEKILALLSREVGRDVYDLFFMASKKWEPDARVLSSKNLAKDPAKAVLNRVASWGPRKLSDMARRLEPFLFEPEQAKLVAQAGQLLPAALDYLNR